MAAVHDCSRKFFPAAHDSGPRKASQIHHVVIHDTEGPTAMSAASWFNNPKSEGSAHVVVDDSECYICLDDLTVPWGAPPLNTSGLHIEQAGYKNYTKVQWQREHRRTIERAARQTADWCESYDIPVVWLSPDDLRARKRGITSHANISEAFGLTNHTDPGLRYPVAYFMSRVSAAIGQQHTAWPVPLPKWVWAWMAWRLQGAKGPRPKRFPRKIPLFAWRRLLDLERNRKAD